MSRAKGRHSLHVVNLNRRIKLSHDPNNTAWSRSATKYGQRILQSHGWTPGELLGASGAPYSGLQSAASASHVKITLKDDNLGLGAKLEAARGSNETTGLDEFQNLLGRLNGRSTTNLTKDRIHRSNLRSSAYMDQRWGNLGFVSGGLLVGAELMDPAKSEHDASNDTQQTPSHYSENRTLPEANRPQEIRSEFSGRKEHKKRKNSRGDHNVKENTMGVDWSSNPVVESERESHTSPKDMFDQVQIDKVRSHAEKAARKLKRRVKRDARQSLRVREQSPILPSPDLIQLASPDIGEVAVASHPLREKNASTKSSQGLGVGRLAVRQRHIQQKKMCMMDKKALNEVCIAWPIWWDSKWLTTRRY